MALLALATFVSGAVVGASLTAMLIHRQRVDMLRHPDRFNGMILDVLRDDLKIDLGGRQMAEVTTSLEQFQERIQTLRREYRPLYDREYEQLETRIGQLLPAEVRPRWQQAFQAARNAWSPPPPPAKSSSAPAGSAPATPAAGK
jgi:hypothetical protein